MEGKELFPTTKGTPQGGVISPLLANIALHGLETYIVSHYTPTKRVNGTATTWQPTVIRYADDFVVLHRDHGVIEEVKELTATWLAGMGLELKPSKTRITHTLTRTEEGYVGFDFLGWHVRQYAVGKHHSGKHMTKLLGFKTIITPSKDAIKEHVKKLDETIRKSTSATQANLIRALNRIIGGWVHYHSTCSAARIF